MCHKRFLVALTLLLATWLGHIDTAAAAPLGRAPALNVVKHALVARPVVAVSHAHIAQLSSNAAVASDHRQDDGVDIDDDDARDAIFESEREASIMNDPRERITEQRDQEFARLRWPAIAARGPPNI